MARARPIAASSAQHVVRAAQSQWEALHGRQESDAEREEETEEGKDREGLTP